MNDSPDSFESRLLTRLREHVETTSPATGRAGERFGPRRTRGRLVWTALAVASVATAVVVVVPGIGAEPAYSVQEGNSGEIEVEVNRIEDAEGLEAALADVGVTAEITYVPGGRQCERDGLDGVARADRGISLELGSDRFIISLAPGTVRDDETLVVDVSVEHLPDEPANEDGLSTSGGTRSWVDARIVQGAVAPCRVVD